MANGLIISSPIVMNLVYGLEALILFGGRDFCSRLCPKVYPASIEVF